MCWGEKKWLEEKFEEKINFLNKKKIDIKKYQKVLKNLKKSYQEIKVKNLKKKLI